MDGTRYKRIKTGCIGKFNDKEHFLRIIPIASEFSIQKVNSSRFHFTENKSPSYFVHERHISVLIATASTESDTNDYDTNSGMIKQNIAASKQNN